ncbi:MAG TPA: N-acetylmuramoyl-L-alanine amidase [Gammaproteobacteria bacterium]|nr:N-acetylmuramoyl-L-alanine amidase [Gammaproteobacteria bacterium]
MHKATFLLAACLACVACGARAAGVRVDGIRVREAPDHVRIVLDLSGRVSHQLFALHHPERLVVDLPDTRLAARLPDVRAVGLVRRLRAGIRRRDDLRLVVDLARAARARSFLLPSRDGSSDRLVLDLFGRDRQEPVRTAVPGPAGAPLVVAIDAGHGGEDPGATANGLEEKNLTLAIARLLYRDMQAAPGLRPVLTRRRDRYVSLRGRMRVARRARADLFVSIHADAYRDPAARGASVYVLSRHGASDEAARWLAQQENAADLRGGVSLEDKDPLVASVLLDLSQTATIDASLDLGSRVLGELGRIGPVHKPRVQQAGFVVLKSPDIPSILVETDFISNPREARRLASSAYQRRVAAAILAGIRRYAAGRRAPDRRVARVAPGHGAPRGEAYAGHAVD